MNRRQSITGFLLVVVISMGIRRQYVFISMRTGGVESAGFGRRAQSATINVFRCCRGS